MGSRLLLALVFVAIGVPSQFIIRVPRELIPANRLVSWTVGTMVGVPGGIPTTRTQCVTTECAAVTGAASGYKDGTLDAASLLQAAITSASANTFVLIPAGTWKLLSGLTIGPTKDNITIRGTTVSSTIFDCRTNTCVFVGSGSDYSWSWPTTGNSVTGYAPEPTTGGTTLTISDTSNFSTGQMVQWAVANDSALPVLSVAGFPKMRRQMTKVVAKTSSSLTVFPPIYGYARFIGQDAVVHVAQFQSDGVGIESLTVDGVNGSVIYALWFEQAYGSWVKDVRTVNSSNYNVFLNDALNCEVRYSTLDVLNHSGSNGAGLLMNTVSGTLIEDNIIRESLPNIEINLGSSGNVIAYNFVANTNGNLGIDTNHGPHNAFNLFEGNIAQNMLSDGYYGSESEGTIYRNLLHGNGIVVTDTLTYCLSLKRFARNFSVVGNILGSTLHINGRCDAYGQPNIGNGFSTGTAQPSTGSYWVDWGPSTTKIAGTLTARPTASTGTITLSSGTLATGEAITLRSSDDLTLYTWAQVGSVAGNTAAVDSSAYATTLPALSTVMTIWAGPIGFQELDIDVLTTLVKKANLFVPTGIPAGENLNGAVLVPSLYLSAKPSWFYSLTWPPFDPLTPNSSYNAIPAGYRYLNAGANPP